MTVCRLHVFSRKGSPSDNACPCVPVPLLDLKVLPDLPQHWCRPVLLKIVHLHIANSASHILQAMHSTLHNTSRLNVLSGAKLSILAGLHPENHASAALLTNGSVKSCKFSTQPQHTPVQAEHLFALLFVQHAGWAGPSLGPRLEQLGQSLLCCFGPPMAARLFPSTSLRECPPVHAPGCGTEPL